jgi:L-Lysine epsilon oxidase N-terminal
MQPRRNRTRTQIVVKAAIYPSIGIARIGNSLTGWYVGPEVPDPLPLPPGSYRDDSGALKREAARFRIYGLNAAGTPVRELTSADADITWTVQLANKKAAWYGFQLALDIPEASAPGATPTTLRNPMVIDRKALAITPAARSVAGASQPEQRFDDGTFMGIPVYLGSVLTDETGRLLVLGGRGVSASYTDAVAITFANNDTWYDDVADGPITAQVSLAGTTLPVEPAWVVMAPPNYGPCRKSVRTLWDLMRDLAVQNSWLTKPKRPSFTHDILPIFQRMAGLQWVNEGFAAGFGWKALFDLTPATIVRMAAADLSNAEWRKVIANQFRTFSLDSNDTVDSWAPVPWPWVYGDAMNQPPTLSPRQHSSLSELQLSQLQQWVAGDFDADYDPNPGRHPDQGRAGLLPGRRLPSRLRDDMAGAPNRHVPGAVPLRSRPGRLGGTRLRHDANLCYRLCPQRLLGAASARRHQPVDGRALAMRHRQLPLRL